MHGSELDSEEMPFPQSQLLLGNWFTNWWSCLLIQVKPLKELKFNSP